jgi:hypothetical protein
MTKSEVKHTREERRKWSTITAILRPQHELFDDQDHKEQRNSRAEKTDQSTKHSCAASVAISELLAHVKKNLCIHFQFNSPPTVCLCHEWRITSSEASEAMPPQSPPPLATCHAYKSLSFFRSVSPSLPLHIKHSTSNMHFLSLSSFSPPPPARCSSDLNLRALTRRRRQRRRRPRPCVFDGDGAQVPSVEHRHLAHGARCDAVAVELLHKP